MLHLGGLLLVVLALLGNGPVPLQQFPQTPQIKTEQQPKSALKNEENGQAKTKDPQSPATTIPPAHLQASGTESERNAQQGSDEASEFWTIFGRRVKVTDSLLVAFTALLFVATLLLWCATRRLVKGAEDTARRQLRAYVAVSHVVIDNKINSEGHHIPHVSVRMKNFGQTPAHDAVYWIRIFSDEFPLKSEPRKPFDAGTHAADIIAPSAILGLTHKVPIDIDGFGICEGTKTLYVCGEFSYRDVFGGKHSTSFCFIRDGEGWSSDGKMTTYGTYNKAT